MRKIIILVVFSMAMLSCKGYLDLKPYGKVIPKTTEEYSAMVHTILNNIEIGKESYIVENRNRASDYETSTDNLDANISTGRDNYPNYLGARLVNNSSDAYSSLYSNIKICNIVLEGISADNSDLAKRLIATSKAIRGACYYQLLRQFCDPVVGGVYPKNGLSLVDEFDMEARPLRSSYENTVRFIEKDLLDAASANNDDLKYMFTSDVAKGYLARLYFWTCNWNSAAKYADELVTKYPLISGEKYREMILSYSLKGNMLLKSNTAVLGSSGQTDVIELLKYRVVGQKFVEIFDNAKNDVRYDISATSKRELKKRPVGTMRSAEFALILAESYYHTGNPKALNVINELRRNRITFYVDLTMETIPEQSTVFQVDAQGKVLTPLIKLILNERRKELFAEGDRLFELKRNGKLSYWISRDGLVYTTLSYMYTFPIPYRDIELIKGLEQNQGYDVFDVK